MQTFRCTTVDELRQVIEGLGPDAVFRGQAREYLAPDGSPSLSTEFSREGCIPLRMLKWQHYASRILEQFVLGRAPGYDLPTDQAILQHYGWRSFFLDATKDAAVAAWFAGHTLETKRQGELVEDVFETPVSVQRTIATYTAGTAEGVMYAISRRALRGRSLQAVDLDEIMLASGRPRYQAQSALMVGPVDDLLPQDCILARISAPAALFRDYAAGSGFTTTASLFPPVHEDPVLHALMSVPWVRRGELASIGVFERGLPLPEYDSTALRRTGSSTAYYTRFWIADAADDSPFAHTDFYLVHEGFFYGSAKPDRPYPLLTKRLRMRPFIVVEMDGLFKTPAAASASQYAKGILLEQQSDGSILVAEVSVDHKGATPGEFGLTRGLYYRPDADGRWTRIDHPEQCDCGNAAHHARHLVVVSRFEHALADDEFTQVGDRLWGSAGVTLGSDPRALCTLRPLAKA